MLYSNFFMKLLSLTLGISCCGIRVNGFRIGSLREDMAENSFEFTITESNICQNLIMII